MTDMDLASMEARLQCVEQLVSTLLLNVGIPENEVKAWIEHLPTAGVSGNSAFNAVKVIKTTMSRMSD